MSDKKPKPKPKLTTAQQNAMLKKSGYKGAGATGKFTDPVLKAKHDLDTEATRQQDKLNKESLGKKLNRAFNAFDMNQYAENAADHQRVKNLEDIYNAARRTSGDTRNVNPINGPIAETHKKAGK